MRNLAEQEKAGKYFKSDANSVQVLEAIKNVKCCHSPLDETHDLCENRRFVYKYHINQLT